MNTSTRGKLCCQNNFIMIGKSDSWVSSCINLGCFYKSCKEFVCLNERKYRTVIRHIVTEGMLKRTCSK